jgi:hypothetical protein
MKLAKVMILSACFAAFVLSFVIDYPGRWIAAPVLLVAVILGARHIERKH